MSGGRFPLALYRALRATAQAHGRGLPPCDVLAAASFLVGELMAEQRDWANNPKEVRARAQINMNRGVVLSEAWQSLEVSEASAPAAERADDATGWMP